MKKIVINSCYGGFGLSLLGMKRLAELRGEDVYFYKQTKRIDPLILDKNSRILSFS